MQCEEVREHFADYVTDRIHESLRTEVAAHLSSCECCQAEMAGAEELSTVWDAMGSIPAPQPGPEARTRFNLMVDAYRQGLDQRGATSRPPRWWSLQPALQFGIGVALLAIGVFVGQQLRPSATPAVSSPADEIAELRGQIAGMNQIIALSLMQQQSASERLRGVNWSYQMQMPGDEVLGALLDALMRDPNVNVRLATVDALRQFGDRSVVRKGVIEAMKMQESPMVQMALIDFAVDLDEKSSIATLREFTKDQRLDTAVRERAQKGLSELE